MAFRYRTAYGHLDRILLSCIVMAGYANALLLGVLSFVHAEQEWYGYGWEIE